MGLVDSLKDSGGRFLRIGVVILAASLTQRANKPVISCTPDQPLVVQKASGLGDDQLAALLDSTTRHVRATASGGGLNQRVFNGTHGFVLQFNRDGVERLRSEYSFLLPFFEAVQEDESNAFVLNALFVPPSPETDVKDYAVKIHVDNTVAITHEQTFYAHSVSVLYLSVPAGMRGGTLNLWRERSLDPLKPDEQVVPSAASDANFIVFRGDAWHSVSAHTTNDSSSSSSGRPTAAARAWDDDEEEGPQPRVSLVLEQYRIPPQLYGFTTPFYMRVDDHRTYEYIIAMGRLASRWPYLAAAGLAWLATIGVLVRKNARRTATDAPKPSSPDAAPAYPVAPTPPPQPPSSRSGSSKKKGKKAAASAPTDEDEGGSEGEGEGEGEAISVVRQLQFCTFGFIGLAALIMIG